MYFNHDDYLSPVRIFGGDDLYQIYFQIEERHPFLHFRTDKITPSIFKSMLDNVDEFKRFLGAVGYPMVFGVVPDDKPALHKLYKKLGFTPLAPHGNNTIYQLYIKEPDTYDEVA